jgi:hypothetical protein
MFDNPLPRELSHDEKKAAEAAFAGRPFNPSWSSSARTVYDGIVQALGSTAASPMPDEQEPAAAEQAATVAQSEARESGTAHEQRDDGTDVVALLAQKRKEAIRTGALIDVTPDAQKLGLTIPVTITRPLWDAGIAPTQSLSEADRAGRLRDVLMAFRLKLSSLVTLSPLIDFPAMLSVPPYSVPQPIPLFALFQPDERHHATVTLLLPNEISATIIPMN